MIVQDAEELGHIRSQVMLAKAIFSNIDLLAVLENGVDGELANRHLINLCSKAEGRAAIASAHVTGRFLRFRKLHPSLTDEALELRISWAMGDFIGEQSALERQSLDDPARCLVALLTRLGKVFLSEARDGSLRIRSRLLAEWQDLVLVVPPMLITAAWMASQQNRSEEMLSDLKNFQIRVQRWLCDSTLPVDDDPFLDQLCKAEGLDETHMHLNGTTEAEKVWIDALRKTTKIVGSVSGVVQKEDGLHTLIGNGVNRLLRQEDPVLTPKLLRQRVEHAVTLKSFLLKSCRSAVARCKYGDLMAESQYATVVRSRVAENGLSITTTEALQLVDIIISLKDSRYHYIRGAAFLWYALIRAQFCRLLVQQVDQVGFDQFQYITFNELRETTEKDFAERFRQIERGYQQPVDFLEGRFAPKTTPAEISNRIMHILRGYLQFLDETPDGNARNSLETKLSDPNVSYNSLSDIMKLVKAFEEGEGKVPQSQRRLRLGLVAHFIKRTDRQERRRFLEDACLRAACRDSKARRETDQSARALVNLMEKTIGLPHMLRGVDAASNERHSSPEVFAPVFRRMRRAGIYRFTYHVGEDFVHLASGLRAINEAILFLGLTAGCRIGHGTAAGLLPTKWWSAVGDSVILPLEERLDDLVFAWGTLVQMGIMLDKLPILDLEIRRLAMEIWKDPSITTDLLLRAWRLRYIDPIVRTYGNHDVDRDRDAEIQLYRESELLDPDAHHHFLRRHGVNVSRDSLRRGQKPILVTRENDILSADILEILQLATLKFLQQQRVAIETLPSSNVRISIHKSYEEHHATEWLGYGRSLCPTSVVVGSDDPGIFATSLRMEYAHLLRALQANGAGLEATSILENLTKTSRRFRF